MLTNNLKATVLLDIGAGIQEVVYNIIETTCSVIFFTVIIIHLCHCLHTHYWISIGPHPEARNDEDSHRQLVAAPYSPVRVSLASSDNIPSSGHASGPTRTSRSPAVSWYSNDKDSTPRPHVLSNAARPSSESFSSLEADAGSLPVNSEKPAVDKPVKSSAPLRISTFTPLLDSSEDPPSKRSGPSTDRPQVSVAAAAPPPTDAASARRLKTASVEFILFLAWKVVSQKRVVFRPRCRIRPAPDLRQRIVRQHLRYNAKIAVSSAALQSHRSVAAPPVLDEAAVLPTPPHMLAPGPSLPSVPVPPAELLVSAPALPSACGLQHYQEPRLRPRALILGKQLYGGRRLKSLGSQPGHASGPRSTSSPNQTFSSSASAGPLGPEVSFSKLGEVVAVRRRNAITRWMFAAANARFSAPVA